jgi:hypothetical protein
MPEYIFVPEESLATIARSEANDPLTALNATDLGPLPKKVTVVQVIGTFWIMDEDDAQVVRKGAKTASTE